MTPERIAALEAAAAESDADAGEVLDSMLAAGRRLRARACRWTRRSRRSRAGASRAASAPLVRHPPGRVAGRVRRPPSRAGEGPGRAV